MTLISQSEGRFFVRANKTEQTKRSSRNRTNNLSFATKNHKSLDLPITKRITFKPWRHYTYTIKV